MTEPTEQPDEEVVTRIRYYSSWQEATVQLARPVGFWVLLLILAVNGLLPPLADFAAGRPVRAIDWEGLAVMAGPMVAYIIARTVDKKGGTQL